MLSWSGQRDWICAVCEACLSHIAMAAGIAFVQSMCKLDNDASRAPAKNIAC